MGKVVMPAEGRIKEDSLQVLFRPSSFVGWCRLSSSDPARLWGGSN